MFCYVIDRSDICNHICSLIYSIDHQVFLLHIFQGGLEESRKFLKALNLVTLAESLGGYESLAELPYLMTHASIEETEVTMLD